MTRQLLIIFVLTILFSCSDNQSDKADVIIEYSESGPTKNEKQFSDAKIDTIKYIWVYDYATEIPVRLTKVNPDTLTPQKLINLINIYRGQNKIVLDLLKVSRDTIYVAIKNSTYLTQSIGTTGADDYVSTTVYTLTELKGIKYVNFNFVEGDHAQPGTFSRQYYIDRSKSTTIHK